MQSMQLECYLLKHRILLFGAGKSIYMYTFIVIELFPRIGYAILIIICL